jgi:hypothetical protein
MVQVPPSRLLAVPWTRSRCTPSTAWHIPACRAISALSACLGHTLFHSNWFMRRCSHHSRGEAHCWQASLPLQARFSSSADGSPTAADAAMSTCSRPLTVPYSSSCAGGELCNCHGSTDQVTLLPTPRKPSQLFGSHRTSTPKLRLCDQVSSAILPDLPGDLSTVGPCGAAISSGWSHARLARTRQSSPELASLLCGTW